jgi:hypothetical protein
MYIMAIISYIYNIWAMGNKANNPKNLKGRVQNKTNRNTQFNYSDFNSRNLNSSLIVIMKLLNLQIILGTQIILILLQI